MAGPLCDPTLPPPVPFPGGCSVDAHCTNAGTCGSTAVCVASQHCGDAAQGTVAQACTTDASCPISTTSGEQMVCSGGTSCIEPCGTLDAGCPTPTVIAAGGGMVSGDTSGGTTELAGSCGGSGSARERTFLWTPATSGTATIQTCGSGFDTVLYLRAGGCSGADVACNDDGCGLQSTISPVVTAGQTSTIVVEAFSGDGGSFTLSVTPP